MVGLGSRGDAPVSPLQPKLVDGVHLRWGFRADLGFPWHGFYLFRRSHKREGRRCLRQSLAGLAVGSLGSALWTGGGGQLRSDTSLIASNDFSEPNVAELDLRERHYLDFLPLERAFAVEIKVGFRSEGKLAVEGHSGETLVAQTIMAGVTGSVTTATLRADAIDKVRISGGDAALVDLCWVSAVNDAAAGWKPLEGLHQPIALPVRHPDYPCSPQATDVDASRDTALMRISYGDPDLWKESFPDLHEQCLNLVRGGPAVAMASPARAVAFTVDPDPANSSAPPDSLQQHPLQLVLLASLNAPHAQMLGLYWSDRTAVPGILYDYLIVADRTGAGGGSANAVLNQMATSGFTQLDGFVAFGLGVAPAPPLAPPEDVRGYALPGATRPDAAGKMVDASCSVGLRWDINTAGLGLLSRGAVFHHVYRADYGAAQPASLSGPEAFTPLNADSPLLVAQSLLSLTGVQRPPDWPPFPLYAFDNALLEGWYGYRLSSVDIFGRHSALSSDAQWFEWAPMPEPRPWYYLDPPGERSVHPFAIRLLDKIPPPPPSAVEASALDPADPFLLRDGAYAAWFATISQAEQGAIIGLRVRWNWTDAHARQAPDTHEFRIYFHPGRMNALAGRTLGVSAASGAETLVATDITHTAGAGAFAGCHLKVGTRLFAILGHEAASPLVLRVGNVGPLHDVAPAALAKCEITVPAGHPLHVDYAAPHAWDERCYVVGFDEHVTLSFDDAGRGLRTYEVLLPADGDPVRRSLPLFPDLASPTAFGAVAVTAADARQHSPDDPKWSLGSFGGRPGNESVASAPAIVFRVLREKPPAPQPPADAERVFASRADYHAASYYTVRWRPQAFLQTHVFRAMDDAVFGLDWSQQPRAPLNPDAPGIFPSEAVDPNWTRPRRQRAVEELDRLASFPHTPEGALQARAFYQALSNDGLRVLASLPGNEAAFTQQTIAPLDAADPAYANRRGPDNAGDFAVDPGLRSFVDKLDGRSTNRYFYRTCQVDGAHNRSLLGPSGPPVWLPSVAAPKPPALTKVLAGDADPGLPGDGKITLRWASNREADLAAYRIYRTPDRDAARSVRAMTLVHSVLVPPGDPATRPAEIVWTDSGVPALVWIYYCLTAIDSAGNESAPSGPVMARAFDEALPPVPPLTVTWTAEVNLARAAWTAATETRLDRRGAVEAIWESVSEWLPPGAHAADQLVDEGAPWRFRLRARKATGAVALGRPVNLPRR